MYLQSATILFAQGAIVPVVLPVTAVMGGVVTGLCALGAGLLLAGHIPALLRRVSPPDDPSSQHREAAVGPELRPQDLEELAGTLNLGLALVRDIDGNIIFWSQGCERLFGWSASEAMGRQTHELLRTDFPVPMAMIEEILLRKGEWVGDLEHRTRTGERVTVISHKRLRRDASGRPVAVLESLTNVTARRMAEARLVESEERMRSVVETATDAIIVADQEGRIVLANQAAARMFGYASPKDLTGDDLGMLMPEAEAARHGAYLAAHGRGNTGGAAPRAMGIPGRRLSGQRRDGREFPIEASVGSFVSNGERYFTGVVRDVSERIRAEELRALLSQEVDHRAKNALAVALSVLRQTPRDDAAVFAASVEGRVAALARAHSLLSTEKWVGADLRKLAQGELEDHSPSMILSGPTVLLNAEAAQPMAMVLHELLTNALKYGALRGEQGRVDLSWEVSEASGELTVHWREQGGPPPAPADDIRQGFGSRLIDTLIRQQLNGQVWHDWRAEGLICVITLPPAGLSHLRGAESMPRRPLPEPEERAGRPDPVSEPKEAPRVLVVEDQVLLAMELEAAVMALGCEVVGPAGNLALAMKLAREEARLAAAIVDVNLGNDEVSFEVVDLLKARGVPYIFSTGHVDREALRGRDRDAAAILLKPFSRKDLSTALDAALGALLRPLP